MGQLQNLWSGPWKCEFLVKFCDFHQVLFF